MMDMLLNKLYMEDIKNVCELSLDWNLLRNCSVMISGATGMIGSFLIDVLMYKNRKEGSNCTIYAVSRNEKKLKTRFQSYLEDQRFRYIIGDINSTSLDLNAVKADYVLHLASNTHPKEYADDPIGTITANVIGTYNLLEYCVRHNTKRFVFASSVEIYGENRGDIEKFDEQYCGYLDCNTLRAGYPESKRVGESLCQAYIKQKSADIVIPRIARTYGPTMLSNDTKAVSQFITKAVNKENIVLKSDGSQFYSYIYVADTVSGILYCLINGRCGEAYNIAGDESNITLRDLANKIAYITGTKVIFEQPDIQEVLGYSKATKAVLNGDKLKKIGWQAVFDLNKGIQRTIEIITFLTHAHYAPFFVSHS